MSTTMIGDVKTTKTYGKAHHSIQFVTGKGKTVLVCHSEGSNSWTVYFNPDCRSVGKTFWSVDEMIGHYKTIKAELMMAIKQISSASNQPNEERHEA